MSKLRLAVSVASFLLCALPMFAQSSASGSPPAPAISNDGSRKLSDEELGRLYLVRKEYPEAQQIFRRLTIEHPQNPQYWNELGIAMHSQSDLVAALKCYERAVKLDKHYSDAQNNMGTIFYARKKYAKAIRAYKRAVNIKDDFAPFYLNLGYAYFGEKQYQDSITSFRKALQFDPEAFDSSRAHSGTVIQDRSISSDRAHFYFLLAKSFAEAGNIERCAIYLKKARDEGYQDMNAVNSDPSFAKVLNDPIIQEALGTRPVETAQP
jgi:tetratricopeptide (TPR) repeat protein